MAVHSREFWATAEVLNRILKMKLCLAEAEDSQCDSAIVRAHTIPRSQLRQIAVDGHVSQVSFSMVHLAQKDGKLAASRVGVNQFSVLNCFCAKHDKVLFADLEDRPLTYSPKQIALLHYRVTGAELFKKIRAIEFSTHNIRQHSSDPERLDFLQTLNYGQRLGFDDAADAFQRTERVLASESNGISALVVYFCNMPTVMTAGGFFPEFDYSCRWMQQPLGKEDRCHGISFSILASEGRAALCMTWLKGDSIPEKFARSFVEQRPELYTTLAIQTAFEHLENTCTSIPWWASLKSVEKRSLLMRMQIAGSVFDDRKSNCLSFDGIKYDDWMFDRYELLNV